jgi:hypothetical protein
MSALPPKEGARNCLASSAKRDISSEYAHHGSEGAEMKKMFDAIAGVLEPF